MTKPSTIKKNKFAPRRSLKMVLVIIGIPLLVVLFVLSFMAGATGNGRTTATCPALTAQVENLYQQYPAVASDASTNGYICANPTFAFGEYTNPSVVVQLGGNGFLEIHADFVNQTGGAANAEPGSLFFVAIQGINNTATEKATSTWLDLNNPDPTIFQIAAGLHVTI